MASRVGQSVATFTRRWHRIDGKGQHVGRLAAQVSTLLQGKHKPTFHPAVDTGDHVVVINAAAVEFTGQKWKQKVYRHHTSYPGGFTTRKVADIAKRKPEEILWKAVNGMLPKNNLRKNRMRNLHLVRGEDESFLEATTSFPVGPTRVAEQGINIVFLSDERKADPKA